MKVSNVAALVLATVITLPTMARGLTDGSIPCQDVANNEAAYGCGMEEENAANRKYMCMKTLGFFDVPIKERPNRFHKPGKILKGDKVVAISKDDQSIVFSDEEKDFKITKEKIKQAIDAKYGAEAASKEKYKVTFQSLEGKISLEFKKKPGQSGYDLGKWKKTQESSDSSDDVLVTLGNQANQAAESSNSLSNMGQALDEKVNSFSEEVDKKVAEIEETYEDKKNQVDVSSDMGALEKIAMKRKIDAEKLSKKEIWLRKKRNAAQLRAQALRKCMNQPQLVSESVLRTNQSGGHFSQSIAGSTNQ